MQEFAQQLETKSRKQATNSKSAQPNIPVFRPKKVKTFFANQKRFIYEFIMREKLILLSILSLVKP